MHYIEGLVIWIVFESRDNVGFEVSRRFYSMTHIYESLEWKSKVFVPLQFLIVLYDVRTLKHHVGTFLSEMNQSGAEG